MQFNIKLLADLEEGTDRKATCFNGVLSKLHKKNNHAFNVSLINQNKELFV